MSLQWTDDPSEAGFEPVRIEKSMRLASSWCERGDVPAIALVVGRGRVALRPQCFGHVNLAETEPLQPDSLFTVASITKPIVAMGVMQLVERGAITLGDRVTDFVPEFGGKGRYRVRVRHLLTHTSGLPDLLPHDRDLRRANAPLSDFSPRRARRN